MLHDVKLQFLDALYMKSRRIPFDGQKDTFRLVNFHRFLSKHIARQF